MTKPRISIITPVYNQASFIHRAIESVFSQTYIYWELIIVNDGSTDAIDTAIAPYLHDDRITYVKHDANQGLGYTLNRAIELAKHNYIAYLPADDVYYPQHLQLLYDTLEKNKNAVLAHSGLKYDYGDYSHASFGRYTFGQIPNSSLQLVQVVHRKSSHRWTERAELVTDDLERMFWGKLRTYGAFLPTNRITAEWVSHPHQRHRIIDELKGGGIYKYKQFYGVKQPLRYQSRQGNLIDEFNEYKNFKELTVTPIEKPLKILLVGELAYNPQRIAALERQGHQLFGLWMSEPYFYNTTGPLPFSSIKDIPPQHWREHIETIRPDVIYALLNHPAVPLAHEVLQHTDIPFVWHFKESPFYCRQKGTWNQLIKLYENADGVIYIHELYKNWIEQTIRRKSPYYILDGDLPPVDYFKNEKKTLLSAIDNEPHTVITGRPFGLTPEDIGKIANHKIHVHWYGDYNQKAHANWLQAAQVNANGYLHLHPTCAAENWTSELSQYDAGWLHIFQSSNEGHLVQVDWLDLNLPARMSTYAAAGLPMIQRNNAMHLVASQMVTKALDIGIFFETYAELAAKLNDRDYLHTIRERAWQARIHFSFDTHTDKLIQFFREVIERKNLK